MYVILKTSAGANPPSEIFSLATDAQKFVSINNKNPSGT